MSDLKKFIQAQQFQLAGSGVSLSDTSIILKSFKLPNSQALITNSDLGTINYATLEGGTAREEAISFTGVTQNADGTATITGVIRGLKFVAPYDQDLSLRDGHGGGTSFVITNGPGFYNEFTSKVNDETIEQLWSFIQNPQKTSDTLAANNRDFVTKNDLIAAALGTVAITGTVQSGTSGEAIALGKLCYLKTSDNRWWKSDAATPATFNGVQLGISQTAPGGAGVSMNVLPFGVDVNQSGLTPGAKYYLSDTAGAISATAGTNAVFVGWALTATTLLFVRNNDINGPTANEKAAMAGTSGTPSVSNKFVTDADTSAAGVANKVIRADANGNLPVEIGVKFSLTGDFLAGDSLTANEAVVVSPYAQSDGGIKRDNEVASASSSYGITIGNNSNRILIVITADNSGGTISAVSAGGNAMTNINSYAGSGGYIKTWFLANPPTGSVTITITGAALMGSSARSFYNASQSAPTQFSNGNTTSAPPLNLGTLTATNQCSAILVFGVSANMSSSSFTGSVDASTQNNVFTNNGSQYTGSAWGGVKFANTVSTPTVNFASGSGTWAVSGVAMVIAPATAPALGLIKATASNTGINGALTEVVGFVYATKAVGSTDVKLYLPNGEVPGFSSLTAGSVYYLSNTAGAIATSAGTTSKKVGVASATTKLIPLIS